MTTIVTAVVSGVGVLLACSLPWGLLLAPANLRVATGLPWAVLPMALYLWVYWRYIGGRLGSPATAALRRERLRANPVAPEAWPLAIITGLVGFGALLTLVTLMARLTAMPETPPIQTPPGMPSATAFALLTMASVVAGVSEEAAFRGYMQGPIEQRFGLAAAILVNGAMFGVLHFPNHPGAVLAMLPYYLSVAALYSGLTWATNSILPAIVLHAGGDVWSLVRLWLTGRPEWQMYQSPPPLIWDAGLDVRFLATLALLAGLTLATVLLCRVVCRVATALGDRRLASSALAP